MEILDTIQIGLQAIDFQGDVILEINQIDIETTKVLRRAITKQIVKRFLATKR